MDETTKKIYVLQVRLSEQELAIVEQLARLEQLPASTMARRMLLMEAEHRGVVVRVSAEGESDGTAK